MREMVKETISTRYDIYRFVRRIGANARIVELGVFKGRNFAKMVSHARPVHAVGIDLWERTEVNRWWSQEVFDLYYHQLLDAKPAMERRTGTKIDYVKGDCHAVVSQFRDGYFDFVYIDSDHRYEYVKRDIDDWWEKLRPGGVMAGHDYVERTSSHGPDDWMWGVIAAVNEFACANNVPWLHVTTRDSYPSWMFVKPE
jgi:hypothetical protein